MNKESGKIHKAAAAGQVIMGVAVKKQDGQKEKEDGRNRVALH